MKSVGRKFMTLLLAVLLLSCRQAGKQAPPPKPEGVEKTTKRGPAELLVRVDRRVLSIADRFTLTIELRLPEAYKPEFPSAATYLGDFGIVDHQALEPRLQDGGILLYRHRFELEPLLSGHYEIPPFTVRFRRDGEKGNHEITSEAIPIEVTSILKDSDKLVLKDIAGPLTPPARLPKWLPWTAAGGAGLMGLIIAGVMWQRHRRRITPAVAVDPAAAAFEKLRRLGRAELIENGRYKEFYLQLSAILRHYIEARFGLRAPERTTEEFLAELNAADLLPPSRKDLLRNFLRHCDQVKFAGHRPSNEEIQKAFDCCRDFIAATREGEP